MITLVHGNDTLSSRNYFLSQKDNYSITFDSETINLIEFSQSLQGTGLFENPKKIFIENLFTRKGSKNINPVGEILKRNNKSEIFIWADKEIGIKVLVQFPKFENLNFKIPVNLWNFLDGIKPGNSRNTVAFHNALSGSEAEIVFSMIIRQFRLLLGISSESLKNADEVKKLATWQKSKLMRQASLFDISSLKEIYRRLYKIEKNIKTGSSALTLTQNIDILLLEI